MKIVADLSKWFMRSSPECLPKTRDTCEFRFSKYNVELTEHIMVEPQPAQNTKPWNHPPFLQPDTIAI